MEKFVRTDLASEAHSLWRQRQKTRSLPGVFSERREEDGFALEIVEVRDQNASSELCKPIGRYVTMELGALLRREADAFKRACAVLSKELRAQLDLRAGESVLVVALGNADITPDAVGPLTAEQVLVTRHLTEQMPEEFGVFRPVSVFCSGVLGTTGVESAALTGAVARLVAPARIIAVDALAACETAHLCRTVQVSDTGIVPGSGVGNARSALTGETLGVPVVALGVPTVVDARTLCVEWTGDEGNAPDGELFVTPRDIDCRVRDVARLLGYSINLALHDGLTVEDIDMYLS